MMLASRKVDLGDRQPRIPPFEASSAIWSDVVTGSSSLRHCDRAIAPRLLDQPLNNVVYVFRLL